MNIRNLKFNSSIALNVKYNTTHNVSSVIYNGTTVFGGEEESAETIFEIYPEFIASNDNAILPYIRNLSYVLPGNKGNMVKLTGNSNFFINAKQNNTGKVNILHTHNNNEEIYYDFAYKIDDLGYGLIRRWDENVWPGGDSGANSYGTFSTTFTPENDTSLAKTITLGIEVDENETSFLKGLYRSKLIRIPASGINSHLTLLTFPYIFADPYFENDPKFYIIDLSKIGTNDENLELIRSGTATEYTLEQLIQNEFFNEESLLEKLSSLEYVLNFGIDENLTNSYKTFLLGITCNKVYKSLGGLYGRDTNLVHFIQEPYSTNRIYYGVVPNAPKAWEPNYTEGIENFHYIFLFASSEIVTSSLDIPVKNKTGNSNKRKNILAVPHNLSYAISSNTGLNTTLLTNDYYWGNQRYDIYLLDTSSDTIYTLNVQ